MVVGVLKVSLSLHGVRSLKGKRKVIHSLKDKIKTRFNVSIAEVDHHDFHQSAALGLCVVAADAAHANSQLQKALNYIADQADVSGSALELISM